MTLVLDSGGVSALAADRVLLHRLLIEEPGLPLVPAVVLVECLTGDHGRDHATDRFLRTCLVVPVVESVARDAARLRTTAGRSGSISAADALVAAQALATLRPLVVTSDPRDLRSLAEASIRGFPVLAV